MDDRDYVLKLGEIQGTLKGIDARLERMENAQGSQNENTERRLTALEHFRSRAMVIVVLIPLVLTPVVTNIDVLASVLTRVVSVSVN